MSNENSGGTAAAAPSGAKTFTQSEIDAIMGSVRNEASERAQRALLKEIGFEKADDVKAMLAKLKQLEQAQLSDAERVKVELDAAKAEARKEREAREAAMTSANERLLKAEVLAAARDAGFADINDAWVFVDKAKIAQDGDAYKGVKEAVEAVLKAKPHLAKRDDSRAAGTPRPTRATSQSGKQPAAMRVTI